MDIVFERRPAVYAKRLLANQPGGSLPTSEDLWSDLLDRSPRQPAFRLVRAGDTTGRTGITRSVGFGNRRLSDVIDANAVIERYRLGDTVVLQGLQHSDRRLARLATNLALELDQPVQVNAYLSPPGERGLNLHFDFHDVFVIQLSGSKQWKIWSPLERSVDALKSEISIPPPRPEEVGDALLDVTLRAGDVLYLPRGYPHVAATTDELSDHLTVGMSPISVYRYLQHAVEVAVGNRAFRASLGRHLLSHGATPTLPQLDPLAEGGDDLEFRAWLAKTVWRRMPQTRLRPRVSINRVPRYVRLAPGPLLWLMASGERVWLGHGDRRLSLPIEAHSFLYDLLARQGSVEVTRLGGLDQDSRSVVIRRLLNVGVLVPASETAADVPLGPHD